MAKSVLLIGGAGYIGPVIADELLAEGYKITVLDSLIYDNRFALKKISLDKNFTFIEGDMSDHIKLKQALIGVSDVVILAGLVGDPISKKYPEAAKFINDESINTCIGLLAEYDLRRVIFISTCSNYGLIPVEIMANENYPTAPVSTYAKSKVNAEKILLSYGDRNDFTPTVLRFATAFGVAPRMRFDLTINEFCREAALEQEVTVFDPDTWRPYCHVRDFAKILRLVLSAPQEIIRNEVFNAGCESNNFTKRQIVDLILKFKPNAKFKYSQSGTDPRNYKVDFSKIKAKLGFVPEFSVENGILEVLKYFNDGMYIKNTNLNFYGNYHLDVN